MTQRGERILNAANFTKSSENSTDGNENPSDSKDKQQPHTKRNDLKKFNPDKRPPLKIDMGELKCYNCNVYGHIAKVCEIKIEHTEALSVTTGA